MKRYMRGLVALIVILGISGGNASAQSACVIEGTGPGSVNECEIVDQETCEANNGTFISIDNDNEQGSETGDGETTGNANNTNTTDVTINLENGTCVVPAVVTPVTPDAPVTPTTGTGATAVTPAPVVAVLPNTASNSVAQVAAIGFVALMTVASIAGTAIAIYRRVALK